MTALVGTALASTSAAHSGDGTASSRAGVASQGPGESGFDDILAMLMNALQIQPIPASPASAPNSQPHAGHSNDDSANAPGEPSSPPASTEHGNEAFVSSGEPSVVQVGVARVLPANVPSFEQSLAPQMNTAGQPRASAEQPVPVHTIPVNVVSPAANIALPAAQVHSQPAVASGPSPNDGSKTSLSTARTPATKAISSSAAPLASANDASRAAQVSNARGNDLSVADTLKQLSGSIAILSGDSKGASDTAGAVTGVPAKGPDPSASTNDSVRVAADQAFEQAAQDALHQQDATSSTDTPVLAVHSGEPTAKPPSAASGEHSPDNQPSGSAIRSPSATNAQPLSLQHSVPENASPAPSPSNATAMTNQPAASAGAGPQAAPPANPQTAPNAPVQAAASSQLPHPDLNAFALSVATKSQTGAKQFDIRLEPAELGRVEVRLSLDGQGTAQAHLSAERPETLALLQNNSSSLARALQDSGVQVAQNGLQFSLKGQQDRHGESGQRHASRGHSSTPQSVGTLGASNMAPSTYGLPPSGEGVNILV